MLIPERRAFDIGLGSLEPHLQEQSSLLRLFLLCLLASFFDFSACYKDGKNEVCFNLSSVSHLPRLGLCSSIERKDARCRRVFFVSV